ncbi:hypothetical protein NDU88_011176 [Pleurodeles waltl]|uniref:Uncharacterized protein n=1 Tax=Pleurodeles waltl TaxID=8319 RepID=A0AAV7Q4A5_PLEWA|nr:hypothetical protein NDU88_011176 [Pleurodeles waltl]
MVAVRGLQQRCSVVAQCRGARPAAAVHGSGAWPAAVAQCSGAAQCTWPAGGAWPAAVVQCSGAVWWHSAVAHGLQLWFMVAVRGLQQWRSVVAQRSAHGLQLVRGLQQWCSAVEQCGGAVQWHMDCSCGSW